MLLVVKLMWWRASPTSTLCFGDYGLVFVTCGCFIPMSRGLGLISRVQWLFLFLSAGFLALLAPEEEGEETDG